VWGAGKLTGFHPSVNPPPTCCFSVIAPHYCMLPSSFCRVESKRAGGVIDFVECWSLTTDSDKLNRHSAWHLLDRLDFELEAAIKRGVKVSIALWHPDSDFLKYRQKVIGGDLTYVEREIRDNRSALNNLHVYDHPYKNLSVRWCTGELGSVSIFWIDDLIYFSTYWIGDHVSDGPHFLVPSHSDTGEKLRAQYDEMLVTSVSESFCCAKQLT
jgi:hypothetical protein